MTTRADLERHLYAAITGNRLSARTHTVDNAIREIGSRVKQPWTVAGVSRETWRRWRNGSQKPSRRAQGGLLAALRRLRLSKGREARLRASTGITVRAHDNYEDTQRDLGPTTFDKTAGQITQLVNGLLDAYLNRGIGAAVDVWLQAFPKSGGWAQEWLHPDSHGSSQSMDPIVIDLLSGPTRAGRRR